MTRAVLLAALFLAAIPATARGQGRPAAPPPAAPGRPAAGPTLRLEDAVALVLRRNERARIEAQDVAAAEARVRRARSFFFPAVGLSATYTRRARAVTRDGAVLQDDDAFAGVASLTATLFDARSIPLYRQARLLRDATELEARETRRLLMFEAADAFLVTLGLEQVRAAAERRLAFARASLADARARLEAGIVSSNDVTRAELEEANAQQAVLAAQADAATAYLSLGYLLDLPVRGPLHEPEGLLARAARPTAAERALVAAAADRRLDLQALVLEARALHEHAKEPSRRLWPSLGVTGTYRGTNETGFSGRHTDWAVALTLTWELYDGGERYAEEDEREAIAAAADLTAQAERRAVSLQVRQALVQLAKAQATIAQAEASVAAARKNADETTILYRQGLTTSLAVSDAGQRLFEAEVALARSRYGLALAYLDLRAAVGLDPLGTEPLS